MTTNPPCLLVLDRAEATASICDWKLTNHIVCAVNIDEVYALEQLYKDVSNSLHQVRHTHAAPPSLLIRVTVTRKMHALPEVLTPAPWPSSGVTPCCCAGPFSHPCSMHSCLSLCPQDGVIQKDEFMQALFNTQPGNGNLFADRVCVTSQLPHMPYDLHLFVQPLSCVRSCSCCSI